MEKFSIRETLLMSHLRGLISLFPEGKYTVDISDANGTILNVTCNKSRKLSEKKAIDQMFVGFGNNKAA